MNFLRSVFLSAAFGPVLAGASHLTILSPEFTYPSEPIAVWGSQPVSLEIRSTELLETPTMYLIGGSLAAPVSIESLDLQELGSEASLKHYELSFKCPEFRDLQACMLKFPRQGLSLRIEVYPWHYVDRLRDELRQYQLKLFEDGGLFEKFFSDLKIPLERNVVTPSYKLYLEQSEFSLLEHKDRGLSVWHTKASALQADDPHSVLRFLQIIKLSNKTTNYPIYE